MHGEGFLMAIKIAQAAASGISVSQSVPRLTLSKIGAQGAAFDAVVGSASDHLITTPHRA